MFGSLGLPELVLIFIVALLLFGPRKLPEIGRTVGKALGEFRRASNDLKRTLEDEVAAEDLRGAHQDLHDAVRDPYSSPEAASTVAPNDPDARVTELSPQRADEASPASDADEKAVDPNSDPLERR